MNARKVLPIGTVVAAMAGCMWFYFSPYIALQRLKTAAQEGKTEELVELVDFPAVRESLKEGIRTAMLREMGKMEDNPLAALGMMMAGAMVEPMVEMFITPSGLAALSGGRRPAGVREEQPPEHREAAPRQAAEMRDQEPAMLMGYEGLSTFSVRFIDKNTGKEEVALVMRRQGFSWKLTSIRLRF